MALTAEESQYIEGDVIVTFKPSASAESATATLKRRSMGFHQRFDWLSAKRGRQTGLVRQKGKTTAQLIAELKSDPNVESAEPNYLRWVSATPNDTRFSEQWALKNTGQKVNGATGTWGSDIRFNEAWAISRDDSQEVVVAVIDTGVDYRHPDLAANAWVNPAEQSDNGLDNDSNGYANDYFGFDFSGNKPNPMDSGDHGTHVAGIIAAVGNNQLGIIGVNHRAKVMALRVSSDGNSISTSAAIKAMQYVAMMKERGVNIVAVNASYGGGGNIAAEKAAIEALAKDDIIVCVAAGNDGRNNDLTATYPANYRTSNMIVVAATDQNDNLASFSNFGPSKVDIAAPGKNILSLAPSSIDVKAGGKTYSGELMTYSGNTSGLSGKLVYCSLGGKLSDFPSSVNGNIALIERGTYTFAEKVANAMSAGAKAVVVYNNVGPDSTNPTGVFLGTLGGPGSWVPTISISLSSGLALRLQSPVDAELLPSGRYQYMSGTSMATPHVSGAVALAARNFPKENLAERMQRILSAVEVKPSLSDKIASGGRLNLRLIVDSNQDGLADWLEQSSPAAPLIITSSALRGGIVNEPYTNTLTAVSGVSPYTWTVISGAPPPGLTLKDNGEISGTPTTAGTFTFAATVRDGADETSSRVFTVQIGNAPLAITTFPLLTKGAVTVPYNLKLTAIGGTSEYSWTVTAGELPPGLSFSSDGTVSGIPTTMGAFDFIAQVSDGGLTTDSRTFTLVIGPQPLELTTSSLAVGAVGVSYSQTLTGIGGLAGHAYSIKSGTLPPGLTLSPDGVISGLPALAGNFDIEFLLYDGVGSQDTKLLQIIIEQTPVAITTNSVMVEGVKNVPYIQFLQAAGGSGFYSWKLLSGELPKGFMLHAATGLISGKTSVVGTYPLTISVTDSVGYVTQKSFTLVIDGTYTKPVVNPIDFSTTRVGKAYIYQLFASHYPKSFSVKNLPPGLKYSSSTGLISGHPSVAGSFDVEVKASNPAGTSESVIATLVVDPVPLGLIGTYTGIIGRQRASEFYHGGTLQATITQKGTYTLKLTVGVTTKSFKGYLLDDGIDIDAPLKKGNLSLKFIQDGLYLHGDYGDSGALAWRTVWDKDRRADSRVGYYSVALGLAEEKDHNSVDVPQGYGFASFNVKATGSVTLAGKLADGSSFTSAGILGPIGQISVHKPLYSKKGSILGIFDLTEAGIESVPNNTATGYISWYRPATKTHVYANGFNKPIIVSVFGKYLAPNTKHNLTLGLPSDGPATLSFSQGGVERSETNPDVHSFTYSSSATAVSMTKVDLAGNPNQTTLKINPKTGLISGTFTLKEESPKLTRKVSFHGIIIRPFSGYTKAMGYFLLPQIPDSGEKVKHMPILSGKVTIDQPSVSESDN